MDRKAVLKQLINKVQTDYKLKPPMAFEAEGFNRRKEMVACELLIETMEENGASDEELMDVLTYSVVVVEAEKHLLDWHKAYDELKIDDYIKKYVEGDLLWKK